MASEREILRQYTQMRNAIEAGLVADVRNLLEEGVPVDIRGGEFDATPMHIAFSGFAEKEATAEIVRVLAAAGGSVNAKDKDDESPMHWGVRNSFIDGCEALLDLGADINARSRKNETPLHAAVELEEEESVEFLIAAGAAIDLVDEMNITPLSSAVVVQSLPICKMLIDAGASPSFVPEAAHPDYLTSCQMAVVTTNLDALELFVRECGESVDQKTLGDKPLLDLVRKPEMAELLLSLKTELEVQAALGDTGSSAGKTSPRKAVGSPSL